MLLPELAFAKGLQEIKRACQEMRDAIQETKKSEEPSWSIFK